jgi:hypothetical protein
MFGSGKGDHSNSTRITSFYSCKYTKIECLSRFGVLEPSVDLFETCEITLTPGIIDTQAPEKKYFCA